MGRLLQFLLQGFFQSALWAVATGLFFAFGGGTVVTAIVAQVTEPDEWQDVLFLVGLFFLTTAVLMAGVRVALEHVPTKYVLPLPKPVDVYTRTLRGTLMVIRGELTHAVELVKEMMDPDGEYWYPTDPHSNWLLPQGRWNSGHELIAQEKSLRQTYLTIQGAYGETGRLERIRGSAWALHPARGSLAAHRARIQRSVDDDRLEDLFTAADAAVAAIDASAEALVDK